MSVPSSPRGKAIPPLSLTARGQTRLPALMPRPTRGPGTGSSRGQRRGDADVDQLKTDAADPLHEPVQGALVGQVGAERGDARAQDGSLLVDDDFLVLISSWWEPLAFTVPQTRPGAQWHAEIDSYDPAVPDHAPARSAGDQVTVGPRSVAVLRAPRAQ